MFGTMRTTQQQGAGCLLLSTRLEVAKTQSCQSSKPTKKTSRVGSFLRQHKASPEEVTRDPTNSKWPKERIALFSCWTSDPSSSLRDTRDAQEGWKWDPGTARCKVLEAPLTSRGLGRPFPTERPLAARCDGASSIPSASTSRY